MEKRKGEKTEGKEIEELNMIIPLSILGGRQHSVSVFVIELLVGALGKRNSSPLLMGVQLVAAAVEMSVGKTRIRIENIIPQ